MMPARFRSRSALAALVVVAISAAPSSVMAQPSKGRALYGEYCTQCHEAEQGDWGSRESREFTAYVMRTPRRVLTQRIINGGKLCPSYLVIFSSEDVDNVVDYIKVLR